MKAPKILRILFGFALIAVLFYLVKWHSVITDIKGAELWLIVLGGMQVFSGVFISSLRWLAILDSSNFALSKWKAFKLYLESTFFSNFLPTSFGGDAYRYWILSKENPGRATTIGSSIIFERGSGFVAMFFINILLIPFFLRFILSSHVLIVIEACFVSILFALVALFFFRKKVIRLLRRSNSKSRFYQKFLQVVETIDSYHSVNLVSKTLGYSFVFIVNNTLGYWAFFAAFHIQVSFWFLLFSLTMIQIISILPISFNALGIFEGLFVFLFATISIPSAEVLAAVLIARIAIVLASTAGGLLYLFDSSPVAKS